MKRILLRVLPPGKDTGADFDMDWKNIIAQVMRRPLDQERGIEIDEMRKSIKILDLVEKSNGVLELEDADWELLKQKTLAMPWAVVDPRIVQFHDEVVMATDKAPVE
jgi:hypothetical protein